MRNKLILAVALLAVAVALPLAYAAGEKAGEKKALKHPWLPEKWSEPSGLTTLEAECLRMSYGHQKPVEVEGKLAVTKLLVEPKPAGLAVTAEVALKPGQTDEPTRQQLNGMVIRFGQEFRLRTQLLCPMRVALTVGGKEVTHHEWTR